MNRYKVELGFEELGGSLFVVVEAAAPEFAEALARAAFPHAAWICVHD